MKIASKKNSIGKIVRRTRITKSDKEVNFIGLKEKLDEAEKVLSSLTNPELLRG